MCWKWYKEENSLKAVELNLGPLSENSTDRIPCLAKMDLSALTTLAEVVDCN